jgi:hypothetical protein
MSRKNRAFALAVATAALVGVSAPVAHAAGPSGFNNDSLLSASGNQVPLQACNNDIPVNAGVLAGQLPLSDISAILGLVNSGSLTSSATRSCAQTPSQAITSTTSTGNTVTNAPMAPAGPGNMGAPGAPGSGPAFTGGHQNTTSGFNNDSLVDLSNNQLPVQACNNDIPINGGLGVVQVPVDGVSGALGLLNSGPISSSVSRNCAQTPTQTNSSSTSTGNTVTGG